MLSHIFFCCCYSAVCSFRFTIDSISLSSRFMHKVRAQPIKSEYFNNEFSTFRPEHFKQDDADDAATFALKLKSAASNNFKNGNYVTKIRPLLERIVLENRNLDGPIFTDIVYSMPKLGFSIANIKPVICGRIIQNFLKDVSCETSEFIKSFSGLANCAIKISNFSIKDKNHLLRKILQVVNAKLSVRCFTNLINRCEKLKLVSMPVLSYNFTFLSVWLSSILTFINLIKICKTPC